MTVLDQPAYSVLTVTQVEPVNTFLQLHAIVQLLLYECPTFGPVFCSAKGYEGLNLK